MDIKKDLLRRFTNFLKKSSAKGIKGEIKPNQQ